MKLGIAKLIDDSIIEKSKKEASRNYLGASYLGEECSRKIWYMYKNPKPVDDARVQRIFSVGHYLENYVINLLIDAGLEVWCEQEDGKQFGFVDGAIAGHCDGVVKGLPESTAPHLLEIKTSNSKRFKEFKDKGCEKAEIKYWIQCQVYMYKLGLSDALFVVLNKDDQDMYYERIKLNKNTAEQYILRGKEIAEQDEPPFRKYSKPTFFKCKFCSYSSECWKGFEE